MIRHDHKLSTFVAASALALGVIFASSSAFAGEKSAQRAAGQPLGAALVVDGQQSAYWTRSAPDDGVLGKRSYFRSERGPLRAGASRAAFVEAARARLTAAAHVAGNALRMIATAYTAGCYGCSGITASGARAGRGIVAVDPRVIPLGSRLYVPGYGPALAGDTGGAIKGLRIDLGFNSLADALRFGRREITVYVLR